ncbi:helix-turn-helix domain-containing protein [Aquimarina sp. I32.4]|uniref:helix-turn-helix domain-containing protein n=1 Tax=Aquimarina sp. I32.4 TaxID=2053903 RepID=UPI000CDEE8A8|nr:helix-turn-helix domain-containing protein [Aquimarina sp. I32.4]
MSDVLKPLYTLTVGEYTELNRRIIRQQFQELLIDQRQRNLKPDQDIIFIKEACELTGYTKPTMYSKISRYELPVLSRGKPLTFSKKALIDWIHQGKPLISDTIEAEDYLQSPKR